MLQDQTVLKNISATANFPQAIIGGIYTFAVVATWGGGSVTLRQIGPDDSTELSVTAAINANGGTTLYLAPGTYQLSVTTATAVYASLTRIPIC